MSASPRKFCLGLLATLVMLLPATSAIAGDPPSISEEWLFTVKQGQMKNFFEAVGQHAAVRAENNDPYSWDVYRALLGDELNKVAIRYCCFNWSDADDYLKWEKDHPEVQSHWMETVDPFVEKTEHYFEQLDWPNSHWSDKGGPYRYFGVTTFKPKAGHSSDFDGARDKMSQIAINQGWATDQRSWLWLRSIGGVANEAIVVPYTNLAGMAGGEQTFFQFLSEHMGSDEKAAELMHQFEASTWGSSFQLWEHLPSLSMDAKD